MVGPYHSRLYAPPSRDALAELSLNGLPHATEPAYGVLLTQAAMAEALSYMAYNADVMWRGATLSSMRAAAS